MKEAKITCACKAYHVADLGLDLKRGDVVYLPAEQARTSHDLDVAKWAKGVRVEYVQRTQTVKKRIPEVVRHSFGVIPPPPPPPKPEPISREVELSAEIQALRAQLAGFQAIVLEALQTRPAASAPSPQTAPVSRGTVDAEPEESTPVFIPSRIVDGKAEVKTEVKKKRSKSKGVTDAATALRDARKKKE